LPLDRKLKLSRSPIFWLLAALLAYGPYAQGLFFERDFLHVQLVIGLLGVFAAFSARGTINKTRSRLDWLAVGFFLAYCLSSITAVHAKTAMTETLKILACLIIYWLTAHGGWKQREHINLLRILFWTSLGVSLLGIATALGAIDLAGGYVDNRIYSTFQYPNTLAAYLGFMIILGSYLLYESESTWSWLYSPALYLTALSMVATGSRGGLGFFLLVLPVFFVMLPRQVRSRLLKLVLQNLAIGSVGAFFFLKYVAIGNTVAGWSVIVMGIVISILLETRIKVLATLGWRTLLGIVGVAAIFVLIVYGKSVENPLYRLMNSSLQLHEFQERLTYYRDGLNMILARPIQGFGGGAWALYPRYQGYPYWVSDPHNNLIKVGLESGFMGAAFYLALWVGLGVIAWKRKLQGEVLAPILFSAVLIFGLHSLMDFDLSYGFITILVWFCFGIISAQQATASVRSFDLYTRKILLCLAGVVLAGSVISFLLAAEDGAYATVYSEQGKPLAALERLEQAQVKDPFNPQYPTAQAEIFLNSPEAKNLDKAEEAVNTALLLNSTEPRIKNLAARIFVGRGELSKAAVFAEDELSFNTFNPEAYLALANFYEQLAQIATERGNTQEASGYLLSGSKLAQRLQVHLNAMSPRNSALWLSGKPEIPKELTRKCQELADKVQTSSVLP
jgi:tetratricopeptide (TPR) repeat protein